MDFYERTSDWQMQVQSHCSPAVWPLAWLLSSLFAQRLEQFDIPIRSHGAVYEVNSRIVRVLDQRGAQLGAAWLRTLAATEQIIYSGWYGFVALPGASCPSLRVVFPLPNGSFNRVDRRQFCGAKRMLHNPSDSNDVDVVIEATEVVRIGREHSGATIACSYGHGSVDDVTGVGHPADLPCSSGLVVVKGKHLAEWRPEKPGQPCLTAAISPGLGNHARRNEERVLILKCSDDDRHNMAIVSLESDECPSIENNGVHRPSARSAAFRSAAVSGPPVSASISSSSEARSSSFVCSSNARAT